MNIKKIITFILVMIITISTVLPISVSASTYTTKEMQKQTYEGTKVTFTYYATDTWSDVYVFQGNGKINLLLVRPDTTLTFTNQEAGLLTCPDGFYYYQFSTMTEVNDFLFNNSPSSLYLSYAERIYVYQTITYTKELNGNYTGTEGDTSIIAKSLEDYYSDYYYEKYGYYPYNITINVSYMCNGETITTENQTTFQIMAGETKKINEFVSLIEGYNITDININGQYIGLIEDYFFTTDTDITVLLEEQKATADLSGITSTLEKLLALMSNPLGDKWKIIFPNAHETIMNNLQNNKFFVSVTAIRNTLTSLFEEDYSSRTGFYELGLFDITVGVPSQDVYTDYGNPATGEWRVGKIETGKIDWGLKNANLLNLDWFFGKEWEENGNTYYTKGVKEYSDTIIGAFMWLVFGWWLWHNLPDMVMGDIGTVGNLTTRYTTSQEKEQMAAQKQAEQNYKNSYEAYKERMDRTTQYKERYKKEKGGK